jgi:hypothetical protein
MGDHIMFLVEFQDGRLISEQDTTWKDLDDSTPLKMVLLCNNNVVVGLVEMDEYWFSNQAVAVQGQEGDQGKLVAQIIGGTKDGKEIEFVQSTITGSMAFHYENKYRITADHKNGRSVRCE